MQSPAEVRNFYPKDNGTPCEGEHMDCPSCKQPTLRTFTFGPKCDLSQGDTLTLCSCGYESGHEILRAGSVESIRQIPTDLHRLWTDMLPRQGLGENVGFNPQWLTYTPTYRETDEPFNYSLEGKPARQPRHTEARRLALAEARLARKKRHNIQTSRAFARMGWLVGLGRARYVGITRNENQPLVEENGGELR